MRIRKMELCDYEQTYELWLSCNGMGLNNLDDSKAGIEKFLKRNPETCFVAEDKNKNQGIATMLVNKAMEALWKLGINKTALVVFSKNICGNAFWEKMGFTLREDLAYRNKAMTELVRIDT